MVSETKSNKLDIVIETYIENNKEHHPELCKSIRIGFELDERIKNRKIPTGCFPS